MKTTTTKNKTAKTAKTAKAITTAPVQQEAKTAPVAKATKTAEVKKPAATPKATKPETKAEPILRLYGCGEFYFPKAARTMLNGQDHVKIETKGKTVTLTPTKAGKDTQPLGYCHSAPVLRVAKVLAETGWSKTTQNLPIKHVNGTIQVVIA